MVVTGTGFLAGASGILTATPVGVIAPLPFTVGPGRVIAFTATILPGAPAGQAIFIATADVTKAAIFTVKALPAAITLAPTSGLRGAVVMVTGVRFPAHAPGTITAPGVITPVTFMTDGAGAIPATPVTILPGAPAGPATFTVTAPAVTMTAPFTVIVPTITLAPTSGVRGTVVTVTGTGFPPGALGIITAPGVITPVTFTTTADGRIPGTPIHPAVVPPVGEMPVTVTILSVPPAPFGLATMTVTVGVASAEAFFTVLPPPAAAVTLSPTAGARGTVVTVTGAGFPAGIPGVVMSPGVIAPLGFTTGPLPLAQLRGRGARR